MLLEENGKLHPVEIKLTADPTKSTIKNFNIIQDYTDGALICMRDEDLPLSTDVNIIPVSYL